MIELSHIHKTYRMGDIAVPALREVSLVIEPGEFIAIMGPSGSGQSTLLHILGLRFCLSAVPPSAAHDRPGKCRSSPPLSFRRQPRSREGEAAPGRSRVG